MSSNRSNLTVDQQFFQELLSAAYTIQEHNDRLNQTSPTPAVTGVPEQQPHSICPQCGASKPDDQAQCKQCGPDEFRPGERMQRKWASMWLLSQQQGLWPERSSNTEETASGDAPPYEIKRGSRATAARDFAGSGIFNVPFESQMEKEAAAPDTNATIYSGNGDRGNGDQGNGDRLNDRVNGRSASKSVPDKFEFETAFPISNWTTEAAENQSAEDLLRQDPPEDLALEDFDPTSAMFHSANNDDVALDDAGLFDGDSSDAADPTLGEYETRRIPLFQRVAEWRVKLRFHRADVYLGTAVLVAGLALLWPVAGSSQQSTLGPWERALVTLGIAEAPPPAVHIQGDPGIEVWVDPHSALYYCPGEEQYGKTADGRFNSQREAQMDRFEPAGRSACE